ncbi:hypothetical protein N0V90_000518 [Kalmusia sp. IMI 367209]|nr:hypothetical protein N0V90_000518 [Kalmusia sp. IMI 367209]
MSKSTDQLLTTANKQYGPITRIGPKQVLLSDPEAIRKVLRVGTDFKRGPWFDTFQLSPGNMSIVAERDPQRHKVIRHALNPSMSGQALSKMETIIDRNVKEWIQFIEAKHASQGHTYRPFDLSKSIKYLTLDAVVEASVGAKFSFFKSDSDPFGFLNQIEIGMMVQQFLSVFTELNGLKHWLAKIPTIRNNIFPHRSHKKGIGRFMAALHDAIDDKRYARGKEDAHEFRMVDSWLSRGVTQEDAVYELVGLIGAGVIPSANAVLGIILGIISHPPVYMKLQREIDDLVAEGTQINFPIQDSVARQMPFLQACIFEGIRKFAPIFFLLDREVPTEGTYLNGYYLPSGTLVSLNMVAVQNDSIYGEDAEHYRPERWITTDQDHFKKMRRTVDLMFGDGSTKCLGIHFAYLELNKIIFEVCAQFPYQ